MYTRKYTEHGDNLSEWKEVEMYDDKYLYYEESVRISSLIGQQK